MYYRLIFALWVLINLAACDPGNGVGLDANGQPTNGIDLSVLTASLGSIQYNIFTPYCSGCHTGPGAPLGLKLDTAENSYDLMVGLNSFQDNNFLRVAPDDPDNSYLVQKIQGIAAIGDRMPLGQSPLTSDMIAAIRQWIVDGAKATSPPGGQNQLEATIVSIQINIFDQHCVDCHSGPAAEQGLILDNTNDSYQGLVDQDSQQVPSLKRIQPTNPDESYLVQKLEGTAAVGERMPLGLTPLPQDQINIVREWISGLPPPLTSTLSSIQFNVFNPRCVSCHGGATPAGDLNLETGTSYGQLVNQPSMGDSNINRVAIGNANISYLIQKLEGNAGLQMPLGGTPLPQSTINIIRAWINAGAADN